MYSTVEDVRSALFPGAGAAPTTDITTAASLPDVQIESAISEADTMIDTYLSVPNGRSVPMDAATGAAQAPVRYWSRNIAAYLATLTFRRGKDLGQDDPVRLRYLDTVTQLVMIRDNKVENPLPVPDQPGGGGDNDPLTLNQYDGNLFGPADFFGYPSPGRGRQFLPVKTWPGY